MRSALAVLALMALGSPALGPIEPAHAPDSQWICDLARDWKALMRRDHPNVGRAMPSVERRCHLPRE